MPALNPTCKRLLGWLWRLAIIALAFLLLRLTLTMTGANLGRDLRQARLPLLLTAALIWGLIQLLAARRWQLLLQVQNMPLTLSEVFQLTMAGNFFNLVIPGAVSGDILKIAFTGQHFPGRKTEIALTMLLDRIIGLGALFAAAFLFTLAGIGQMPQLLRDSPILALALLAVNAGCLSGAGLYLLFRHKERLQRHPLCQRLWNSLQRLLPAPLLRLLGRLDEALELYRERQSVLGRHALLSLCIHLLSAVTLFAIGKALHESAMSFLEYGIATQVANASGIFPLTPGGLGMRDAVSAAFFQAFQVTPAAIAGSIPIAYSLISSLWALAGAFFLLLSPALRAVNAASTSQPQE